MVDDPAVRTEGSESLRRPVSFQRFTERFEAGYKQNAEDLTRPHSKKRATKLAERIAVSRKKVTVSPSTTGASAVCGFRCEQELSTDRR